MQPEKVATFVVAGEKREEMGINFVGSAARSPSPFSFARNSITRGDCSGEMPAACAAFSAFPNSSSMFAVCSV